MAHPFRKKRGPRFRIETREKINVPRRIAIFARREKAYGELTNSVHRAHRLKKAAAISKARHPPEVGMGRKEIAPKTLKKFMEIGKTPLDLRSRPRAFTRKNMIREALVDFYNLLRELRPIGGELSFNHPEIKNWIRYWEKKIGGNWREEILRLAGTRGNMPQREFAVYLSMLSRLRWKGKEGEKNEKK